MVRKHMLSAVASAAALLLAVPSIAMAQSTRHKTVTLNGGATQVTLSEGFSNAVSSLGVKVGTIPTSTTYRGTVLFPITGGALDLNTGLGNIIHAGGLTLTAGNTQAILESFIIDTTGATPVLTGLVVANGTLVGRLPLFDLVAPSGATLPLKPKGWLLTVQGVGLNLTSGAAAALNSVFSVDAFKGGFNVGTANVYAYAYHAHSW